MGHIVHLVFFLFTLCLGNLTANDAPKLKVYKHPRSAMKTPPPPCRNVIGLASKSINALKLSNETLVRLDLLGFKKVRDLAVTNFDNLKVPSVSLKHWLEIARQMENRSGGFLRVGENEQMLAIRLLESHDYGKEKLLSLPVKSWPLTDETKLALDVWRRRFTMRELLTSTPDELKVRTSKELHLAALEELFALLNHFRIEWSFPAGQKIIQEIRASESANLRLLRPITSLSLSSEITHKLLDFTYIQAPRKLRTIHELLSIDPMSLLGEKQKKKLTQDELSVLIAELLRLRRDGAGEYYHYPLPSRWERAAR